MCRSALHQKATSHDSVKKDEQELEVENSKIGEIQITRSDHRKRRSGVMSSRMNRSRIVVPR